MAVEVAFELGNLPAGYCFPGLQQYAADVVALLTGTISGDFSGVIISATTPDVTDQDKGWIQIDDTGRPVGIWVYQGAWVWPNPKSPASAERMIWRDTEANLWSHDGGDGTDPSGTPPTDTTGAMWERDTDFDFAFPVGIGTNSLIYDGGVASVIALDDTGGAERVEISNDEIAHQHFMFNTDTITNAGGDSAVDNTEYVPRTIRHAGDNVPYLIAGGTAGGTATVATVALTSGPDGNATVPADRKTHQNMPPYLGVIFAKRTSRRYFTAT